MYMHHTPYSPYTQAYHGLTFYETFGDLALTTFLHAVGLRDLGMK
jgi:O-acetylhomoserine/O-acetylserine sulfhydrylase-like pyridoxal-dependent enzyme